MSRVLPWSAFYLRGGPGSRRAALPALCRSTSRILVFLLLISPLPIPWPALAQVASPDPGCLDFGQSVQWLGKANFETDGAGRSRQVADGGLASGVYVVRVDAEGVVRTRKITLIR